MRILILSLIYIVLSSSLNAQSYNLSIFQGVGYESISPLPRESFAWVYTVSKQPRETKFDEVNLSRGGTKFPAATAESYHCHVMSSVKDCLIHKNLNLT